MAAIKDIINKLFRRIPSTHVDGDMSIENLSGSGLQMVTTDNDGLLSKQAIPSGGGSEVDALNDLTDVDTTGVSDNDVLQYDSTSGDWLPEDIVDVLSDDTPINGEALIWRPEGIFWCSPENLHIQVRNDDTVDIDAGTPVYSKGEIGGSNRLKVGIADASDPSKMPAIGIAEMDLTTDGSTKDGFASVSGVFNTNFNSFTGLSVGDNLWVGVGGGLTQTKPTGEANLIQNMGIVLKTNGTLCQGFKVSSIDRSNDVPNLNSNNIFIGDSNNAASVSTLTAGSNVSINRDDAANTLTIDATNTVYNHPTHDGDDIDIDTTALTGATVISDLDINVTTDTLGHVTDANGVVSTRTLTLGDLGYSGDSNATDDQTAAEILAALTTVDGAGSGLDADTLDGNQASAFASSGDVTITDNIIPVGTGTGIEDSDLFMGTVNTINHLSTTNNQKLFFHSKDMHVSDTFSQEFIIRSGMGYGTGSQEDTGFFSDATNRSTGGIRILSGELNNFDSGDAITGDVNINAGIAFSLSGTSTQGKVILGNTTKEVEIGSSSFANATTKIKSDVVEIGKSTHTTGNFLKWDGSKAVWDSVPPSGATDLDGLSDVAITSPSNGQILEYNGTNWVNTAGSVGGPGGVDTEVQFNNSGVLDGTSLVRIDETTDTVIVGGNIDITGSANAIVVNSTTGNVAIYAQSTDPDCIIRIEDNATASTNVMGMVATGDDLILRNDEGDFKVKTVNNTSAALTLTQDGDLDINGEYSGEVFMFKESIPAPTINSSRLYNVKKELNWDGSVIARTQTKTLTVSEYQNLGTTAIEIVQAPGSGKTLIVHSVFAKAVNGATAETRIEELSVGFNAFSTTERWGFHKDFLRGMPASATYIRHMAEHHSKLSDSDIVDSPFLAYATGGFTGNPVVKFVVNYSIMEL